MSARDCAVRATAQQAALLAVLALAALASRTAMPVDETRYLAVAWEMWQRGDLLVPHLNGTPYSHKPPLLFWLIHLGWWLFGVNDVTPRLVVPACALAALLLTSAIARALWPQAPRLAARSAWILLGCLLFALFSTMLMFDVLLAVGVALGVLGLVRARGARYGFVLLAVGIGLGLLAKGPAVLLHLLPAALLAPWWARPAQPRAAWYAGVALATLGGAAIALAWAIPAAQRGGSEYADAIFWGQTAHRMVDSFAHQRPAWWYLPWLPVVLAPWILWRPLWQGVRASGYFADPGVRLALALALPAFIAFSLISGKQLHYLLPQFPAFALAAARGLDAEAPASRPWLATAVLILAAVAAAALPFVHLPEALAALGGVGAPTAAVAFVLLAAWIAHRPLPPAAQVPRLAAGAALALAVVHVAFVRSLAPAWDMRPLAHVVADLQRSGTPLAHDGDYHGQFHFAGRLAAPLPEVADLRDATAWLAAHPGGALVVYFRDVRALAAFAPLASQPFRGRSVAVIAGRDALRAATASASLEAEGSPDEGAARPRPPR